MKKSKNAIQNCPICGKSAGDLFAPFCSKRCADIDLGRWLRGDYSTPVIEDDDAPDDSPDDSQL